VSTSINTTPAKSGGLWVNTTLAEKCVTPNTIKPVKFSCLNWSALDGNNIEEIEELYNKVMLTLNRIYQKSAGMVGVVYQTAMSGLEGAKMTDSQVLLDGLCVATAKNEEIRDIITQINIETGCYNSVQSPKLRLAVATLNTAVQVHLLNTQLRKLVEQLRWGGSTKHRWGVSTKL